MKPTPEQVETLARLVLETRPEEIDCDELLDHLARYAELRFAGRPVPPELGPVAEHLRLCPECSEELEALRRALAAS